MMSTENEPTPSLTPEPAPASLISDAVADPAAVVEDPKPAVTEPPAPAPEPLTAEALTIPEGLTIPDDVRDNFLGIMNDDKLSPAERANKLLDLQAGVAKELATAQEKAWADTQEKWTNEVKSDPEFANGKLEPVLGAISQVLDKYGSKELREVFGLTGAGNNVHMVRFLAKVAKDLTEGGPVSGAPPSAGKSLASQLFPSMN
jgi:hypothetical protein